MDCKPALIAHSTSSIARAGSSKGTIPTPIKRSSAEQNPACADYEPELPHTQDWVFLLLG